MERRYLIGDWPVWIQPVLGSFLGIKKVGVWSNWRDICSPIGYYKLGKEILGGKGPYVALILSRARI
jgi:hypothetical protein